MLMEEGMRELWSLLHAAAAAALSLSLSPYGITRLFALPLLPLNERDWIFHLQSVTANCVLIHFNLKFLQVQDGSK